MVKKMKQMKQSFLIQMLLILIVFCILWSLIQMGVIRSYYQMTIMTIGINVILGLGLNLIIGVAGQFSLGHAGFMAIGAYSAALVLKQIPSLWGLLLGILLGMIIAGLVAFIVGFPTLRLTGDYLAIATLGISEIIRIVILNTDSVTGGAIGLSHIPKLTTFPILYFAVVLVAVIIFRYVFSPIGQATNVVAKDAITAESIGINPLKYKLLAFTIGAMTAAIAGGLYASYFSMIKPGDFGFMKSVDILIIVVFGGIGSLKGTIIAAIALGLINMFLQSYSEIRMIIYALALIAIMIIRYGHQSRRWFLKRRQHHETNES